MLFFRKRRMRKRWTFAGIAAIKTRSIRKFFAMNGGPAVRYFPGGAVPHHGDALKNRNIMSRGSAPWRTAWLTRKWNAKRNWIVAVIAVNSV